MSKKTGRDKVVAGLKAMTRIIKKSREEMKEKYPSLLGNMEYQDILMKDMKKKKFKINDLGYVPFVHVLVTAIGEFNAIPIFKVKLPETWEVPDYVEIFYQVNGIVGKFEFKITITDELGKEVQTIKKMVVMK